MKKLLVFLIGLLPVTSCGIYSFSGTNIAPDVKSITINNIANKAMRVNPALSNDLTEALIERYRRYTKLDTGLPNGDLEVTGFITNYEITATGITASETASKNRLTVTIKISFDNKKHPKESFENKSYVAYEEYDSKMSFDAAESSLIPEIIKKLVEQVFLDTVAKW
jgi:dihydroneopterin aldolase